MTEEESITPEESIVPTEPTTSEESATSEETTPPQKTLLQRITDPHFHISNEDGTSVAKIPVAASVVFAVLSPVTIGLHLVAGVAAKLAGKEIGIKGVQE